MGQDRASWPRTNGLFGGRGLAHFHFPIHARLDVVFGSKVTLADGDSDIEQTVQVDQGFALGDAAKGVVRRVP